MTLFEPPVDAWRGETVFIVGGGPSLLSLDVGRLRGRRVVTGNASFLTVPFADFVVFNDPHIVTDFGDEMRAQCEGRIVALYPSIRDESLKLMRRRKLAQIGDARNELPFEWTVLVSLLWFAMLMGSRDLVLLGADGQRARDGRSHHHREYRWGTRNNWRNHQADLAIIAPKLAARGVRVRNANPASAYNVFEFVDPDAVLT